MPPNYKQELKELPGHVMKNVYIHTSHPEATTSYRECMKTLFTQNHETGNVWTSIVAFAVFFSLAAYTHFSPLPIQKLASTSEKSSPIALDKDMFVVAMLMFCCTHVMVTFYHLFCPIPNEYRFWSCFDLVGVQIGIASFSVSLFASGHEPLGYPSWFVSLVGPYSPHVARGLITPPVVLTAICLTTTLCIYWNANMPKNCTVGFAFWVPFMCVSFLVVWPHYIISAWHLTRTKVVIGLLGFGVTQYLLKFPERFFPKIFDVWGHSHMLWHIQFSAGFYILWTGILRDHGIL